MNRNLLMPVAVSLILLSGCKYNDDNFEGLDDMTQPTNLMKIEYTLTDADYATISTNSANVDSAKKYNVSKDLANVKTNMYLTEKITGATYIPAFLLDKYYTADKGSSAKITYKYKEAMSALLSEYASVKYLKPTDADYKLVYGENAFAPYLNEKTEGQMYKMLNENFKDAEKGTAVFATTTALLGQIMQDYKEHAYIVGNIGTPYTSVAQETTDDAVIVAEISSFQLETIHTFHPKVSAILNITPDHLNRHHTMEAYIEAKERIAENQTKADVCVLNYEDDELQKFGEKTILPGVRSRRLQFFLSVSLLLCSRL